MCVNVFKAGLLMYNLRTMKHTLSGSSSMSFDKWIQSHNHTQDTEHFHLPRKYSVKRLFKRWLWVFGHAVWPSKHSAAVAMTPCGAEFQSSSSAAQSARVAAWHLFSLTDPGEDSWHSAPVKNGVQSCAPHWSSLAVDLKCVQRALTF